MPPSPYNTIADLYDSFVQTNFDIPFFLDAARPISGEILDLMAGTGRISLPLIQAGARLTCVDNSPEMLARLQAKLDDRGLTADIRQMDVRALALGKRFDLILMPFHAFAELASAEDQAQTLTAVHRHLADQGKFICALHNPPVRLKSVDGQLHLIGKYPLGQAKLLVWIYQTYHPNSGLVEISEFFEEYDREGRMTSKRIMEMQVSFVEKAAFASLIDAAGFEVVDLYGDYTGAPFDEATSPVMIWVLRRRTV